MTSSEVNPSALPTSTNVFLLLPLYCQGSGVENVNLAPWSIHDSIFQSFPLGYSF